MSSPATLTSTHLPGQLLELFGIVQSAELADIDTTTNQPRNDNIQISFDTEAKTVTLTATLSVAPASVNGGVSYAAVDYLP